MRQINPKTLIALLKQVPETKPHDPIAELKKLSGGAAYLYENVVIALEKGKSINSSELDLDAFNLDDYEILSEYYENNISSDRPEMQKLYFMYSEVCKAAPLSIHTDFI